MVLRDAWLRLNGRPDSDTILIRAQTAIPQLDDTYRPRQGGGVPSNFPSFRHVAKHQHG